MCLLRCGAVKLQNPTCQPFVSLSVLGSQTYMFETTETSGLGAATYLYRGVNFDSSIKSCEGLCDFIRQVQGDGKEIKNLYVGCSDKENENDEDVAKWWRTGTRFTCSSGSNCTQSLPIVSVRVLMRVRAFWSCSQRKPYIQ